MDLGLYYEMMVGFLFYYTTCIILSSLFELFWATHNNLIQSGVYLGNKISLVGRERLFMWKDGRMDAMVWNGYTMRDEI